ncbi:MAG: GNAT family N-acetyltransferase [Bacteroides sp.]
MPTEKEETRQLWECCFHDSEAFTDLYFRLRYRDDINITAQRKGRSVAALQMIPYPMSWEEEVIPTAYISGVCTHPDYRNQGIMGSLLADSFAHMYERGIQLATLIPAEPWLFDYYARFGFASLFRYQVKPFVPSADFMLPSGYHIVYGNIDRKELYEYFHQMQQQRSCYLLHTEEDFRVILADLRLSEGYYALLQHNGKATAIALLYPQADGQGWIAGDWMADTYAAGQTLLEGICHEKKLQGVDIITPAHEEAGSRPLGMARLINASAMLQRYAARHPEVSACFYLTDKELTCNEGCYRIEKGECKKSVGQLASSDYPTLSISQLTEKLLAPQHPYMSLMLN